MPKILIVEDNVINRRLMKKTLESEGYEVMVASNGKEAVEIAQREDISLIIMDIMMDVMDGFEATRLIRKQNQKVPIVAVSAYIHDKSDEEIKEEGFTEYLLKPITPNQLIEVVGKYVVFHHTKKTNTFLNDTMKKEFIEFVAEKIIRLKEATQSNDKDTCYNIGHELKGSGLMYEMAEITNIGRQIEEEAEADNIEKIKSLITRLESEIKINR